MAGWMVGVVDGWSDEDLGLPQIQDSTDGVMN
jgi:hypothetical protein